MRVIAGEARGRRLSVPSGLQVRPSGARLRESAFGILVHRGAIEGARVLDLFAGSGALGIEALSRGALSVTAVEKDARVALCLRKNAEHCGFSERHQILQRSVLAVLPTLLPEPGFDLIFLDPPYGKIDLQEILALVLSVDLLRPNGVILVEHSYGEGPEVCEGLVLDLRRRFGGSEITLFQRVAD